MDMYLRMFDDLKRGDGDNPTVGLILCAEKDEVVARYSILHESQQMFASNYMLYLPTEEELRKRVFPQSVKAVPYKGQTSFRGFPT
jgi:YhcG PDDEXK nuclease domain